MSLLTFSERDPQTIEVHYCNGVHLGDAYIEVDGFWVFQPDTSRGGFWSEHVLFELGEWLKSHNKEWAKMIDHELSQPSKNGR